MDLSYQEILFSKIRDKLDPKHSLVDIITDVLDISKDSAYRRLRCETAVSFDESVKLASYFDISLGQIGGNVENTAVFKRLTFIKSYEDFENYMRVSLAQLEHIEMMKNHQMFYLAKDIPVFYHYAYPELARFKMYVWLKSIYGVEKVKGEYIKMESITDEVMDLARRQWQVYSRINSVEIWNDTTILSLINQIDYYYEAGLLNNRAEAIKLCDQFKEMMVIIYKQAISKRKMYSIESDLYTAANYEMYFHEILIMDNHILTEINGENLVYFTPYAGMNYLSTSDPILTADMKEYILAQMKKSALISNVSEKERNKFFIRIKSRIDLLKERISTTDPFQI